MRHALVLAIAACSSSAPPTAAPNAGPRAPAAPPEATPVAVADPACAPPAPPPADIDPAAESYPDVERLATSKDACAVADNNLARLETAILAPQTPRAALTWTPWKKTMRAPQFLDLVARRFDLRGDELAVLIDQHVVVPARLEQPSYVHAYHEIFQSQLPVYITADSIFHAIFASHDSMIERVERESIEPRLDSAFDAMHCALGAAAADYPADTARDLDFYITVERMLLNGSSDHVASAFGDAATVAAAKAMVDKITAADKVEAVDVLGRRRRIDFTAYLPRGHYAADEHMKAFFRAAMWASRFEFNLVSRSSASSAPGPEPDPRETPREAIDALALADLATRSKADIAIAELDRSWAVLAGKREDVSIADLAHFGIGPLTDPHAFERLKAAIGDRFQRTTRIHPMPEGSKVLPAIATVLGPRIVPDANALMPLAHSAVPLRDWVGVGDVAYALGFDYGKSLLADDLKAYDNLAPQLEVARGIVAKLPVGDDLYSAWLAAVRAIATPPAGKLPTFLTHDVGDRLRLNTLVAAYGQLKHTYVLVAGQPYAEFGCEIPDGYVEPVPEVYEAMIRLVERDVKLAQVFDPNTPADKTHDGRVTRILRVLKRIAEDELEGKELTTSEKQWLGMVAELNVNLGVDTTGHPPMYTGWYFDLFEQREADGMRNAGFVADFFTGQKGVAYAGATPPRLGVFIIDSNGAPRAMVGPVARAYEARGPLAQRFTDDSPPPAKLDPWAKPYTVAAAPAPASLQMHYDGEQKQLVFTSKTDLGAIAIRTLDHHRVPFGATKHVTVKAGDTKLPFVVGKQVGGLYLDAGGFRDYVVRDAYGELGGQWGTPPPQQ